MKIIYVKGPSTCPWNIHGVCGGIEFPIACDWKTCHLKDAPSPKQRNAATGHNSVSPKLLGMKNYFASMLASCQDYERLALITAIRDAVLAQLQA